jgi:hypothetical protein
MALGDVINRIGGAVQTATTAIQRVGLPTPLQIATGALPGAAGVAASVVVAQIERQKREKAAMITKAVNQVSAATTATNTNKAMGAPVLMAGAGNSNILNDLGRNTGAPAVSSATRATGILENIGGSVSFGTQSKTQPLLVVGAVIAAILVALGIRSSLVPGMSKRRRRR